MISPSTVADTETFEAPVSVEEPISNAEKLAKLRVQALKSCAEFSKDLNESRKGKSFYDHHTQLVMAPMNRYYKLKADYTRPQPYPVALIDGQYTSYYKKYSSSELRRMPLRSVIENDSLFPVRRNRSPPSVAVSEAEIQRLEDEAKQKEKKSAQRQVPNVTAAETSSSRATPSRGAAGRRQSNVLITCTVCKVGSYMGRTTLIQCNSCQSSMHPECLDMPPEMMQAIRTYAWSCIDCKKCTVCMKPDNEDAMLCCDACDRGYHTFCVGMDALPNGKWVCKRFCGR